MEKAELLTRHLEPQTSSIMTPLWISVLYLSNFTRVENSNLKRKKTLTSQCKVCGSSQNWRGQREKNHCDQEVNLEARELFWRKHQASNFHQIEWAPFLHPCVLLLNLRSQPKRVENERSFSSIRKRQDLPSAYLFIYSASSSHVANAVAAPTTIPLRNTRGREVVKFCLFHRTISCTNLLFSYLLGAPSRYIHNHLFASMNISTLHARLLFK